MDVSRLYNLFCSDCQVRIDELNAVTKKRDLTSRKKINKAKNLICKPCQQKIKNEIFKQK